VAYLPRLVRDWPRTAGDSPLRSVDGSLVSVDISGFTALSEKLAAKGRAGAEELILFISGLFEGLIGITQRYDGDVLKFRGDALLLLFEGDAHAIRACTAASDMQWFIEHAGATMSSVGEVQLRMSTGVQTARNCHFFLVGSTHRELLVTGPPATAVVRLEDAAEAGEILVSADTAVVLDPDRIEGERDGAFLLRRSDPSGTPPLEPVAEEDGDFSQFVPAALRRHIAEDVLEPEHRHVAVAFVKWSGTDALFAEEGPDAVAACLEALAETVGVAAARYGVTWLESDVDVDGGKLYLTAGAPLSAGDDEERMLLTLREILDADQPLPIQAGVNRGHAFAGEIGATSRRTYAVMGDTVNLAARLAARAGKGNILATGDVLDRSHTRFETEQQPFLVKGKERSVLAYRVGANLGEREDEAPETLPLVGRDAELGVLELSLDAARRRTSALVELAGEPGIGKSRLVEELKTRAVGFTQLVTRGGQYASAAPYFPFHSLLRPLAGIRASDPPDAAGQQLVPWVTAVLPDLAPWLPLLAIPFNAEVAETPEVAEIDPAFRRERLHEVVEQFLTRVLLMPTLLVFEDTHWMDEASTALLRHLSARPGPRPWLLCATRRPEGASVIDEAAANGTLLALEPLPPDQAGELALASAADAPLPQHVLDVLAERAGGNPLFVRELVAAARHGSDLGALPETVESVITTRIDTLDPGDRLLLRASAVIGAVFELALLEEVLGDEATVAVGDLDRWSRLGEFVGREGPSTMRFRHDLFRAVAYEGLSYRRRRALHGSVGLALERRAGEAADAQAELLALHFLRSGDFDRAWRYGVLAGRRAQTQYANGVAIELFGRALEAAAELPGLPPADVAEIAEARGDVAELAARYDDAETSYAQARALLTGDPLTEAQLAVKQGVVRERRARYDEAIAIYDNAMALIEGLGDEAEPVRVKLALGYAAAYYRLARYEDCIHWASDAAERAQRTGQKVELAHTYYLLDVAHTYLGHPDPQYEDLALPLYEELGDLVGHAGFLNNLGIRAYYAGRWDDSLDLYRRSGELSRRAGDAVAAARAANNEAEILSDQGKLPHAEELLAEALRGWRAGAYAFGVGAVTSNLGRAAARAGRFDDGERLLREARAQFEAMGSAGFMIEADARLVERFVLEGRHQDALEIAGGLDDAGIVRPMLDRLLGYAYVQSRQPARAWPCFESSLAGARELNMPYEEGLTLKALADCGRAEHAADAERVLGGLGVEWVPAPPLP
jgi:class 3 adenylate cyclase/tetratricopeptide (TPR) repeat protein